MRSWSKKSLQFFLIFMLAIGWVFSGWPQIFDFPPEVQKAQADTATKTWSFASDTESWSATNPAPTTTATQWQSADGSPANGSLEMRITGKNKSNSGRIWEVAGTWEAIFGIPTGSTVTEVGSGSGNSYNYRVSEYNVGAAGNSGPFAFYDNTPTLQGTFSTATGFSGLVAWGTKTGAAVTVPVGLQASNSTVRFRITNDLATGGDNGAAVTLRQDQVILTITYTPPTVDTPAFDNGTATYNNDVSVAITVASPADAVICYTTDGSTPAASTPGTCSNGTTYSGPVSITANGTVLKAIGTKAGYTNSAEQSATYTLEVGAITSSPGANTYGSTQNVTLSIATTTGATAYYTINGDAVTCSSTTYSGAIEVAVTTTVKAIGCKTNYVSSSAISDLYTINAGPSTAIEVVGKVADTAITTITFPQGAPGATISNPYNDVDTATDAQVLHASASEPVVRLKNTSAGALNITLEITTWTNGIAASEGYVLSDTGTTTTSAVTDNNLSTDGNLASVATGVSIGAGAYKALYLELILSNAAAKTGTSTLTILGETP